MSRRRLVSLILPLIVILSLPLVPGWLPQQLGPKPVQAASHIIVTTLDDEDLANNKCSLREAIKAANSSNAYRGCTAGDGDTTIDMSQLRGTLKLVLGQLPNIATTLHISGPGSEQLVIDGDRKSRLLFVTSGNVRVTGLTFLRGRALGGDAGSGSDGSGGGGGAGGLGGALVVNGGTVTLERVDFRQNQAIGGAGGGVRSAGVGRAGGGGGGGTGGSGGIGDWRADVPGNPQGYGGSGGKGDDGFQGAGGSYGRPGGRDGGRGGDGGGGGGGGGRGFENGGSGAGGIGGFGGGGGGGGGQGTNGGGAGGEIGGFGGGTGGSSNGASARPETAFGGGSAGGGGGNRDSGGGGGGVGLGGALFVRSGQVFLRTVQFVGNEARGGIAGAGTAGASPSRAGQGKGAAIFVCTAAQDSSCNGAVFAVGGTPVFDNTNTSDPGLGECSTGDGEIVCGQISELSHVRVSASGSPSRTQGRSGQFVFERSEPFTGLLTVAFRLGGSATLGLDYRVTGATPSLDGAEWLATFPADTQTLTVSVDPIAGLTPIPETIALSLDDRDEYVRDGTGLAVLTIDGEPAPAWLVMLYIAADDVPPSNGAPGQTSLDGPARRLIGKLIVPTLDQANPAMRLVVLFDGKQPGDSRLYVRNPGEVGLRSVQPGSLWPDFPTGPMPELDTGSSDTLQKFVRWAKGNFGDARYSMLSIIDHGGGWAPDIRDDNVDQSRRKVARQPGGWRGLSLDVSSQNSLSTRNTGEVFAGLGDLGEVDVLFYDACYMGMIESMYEVAPYAKYIVAGQNLLWSSFPYDTYLNRENLTFTTTPTDLAKVIVKNYDAGDDGEGNPNLFSVAAIDTAKLPLLREQVNALAAALLEIIGTERTRLEEAFNATQPFDYDVDMVLEDGKEAYVDLADLAAEIRQHFPQASFPTVFDAASAIVDTIGSCERPGVCLPNRALVDRNWRTGSFIDDSGQERSWSFDQANGISIYFPFAERDCRAIGPETYTPETWPTAPGQVCGGSVPEKVDGVAVVRQLYYYAEAKGQLAFTERPVGREDTWPDLLLALEPGTPSRDPSIDRYGDPYQLRSGLLPAAYLPLVLDLQRPLQPLPDLAVTAIRVLPTSPRAGEPVDVWVTITNVGTQAVEQRFWVDLYVDPCIPPGGEHTWPMVSPYGAAWYVGEPIPVGGQITLKSFAATDGYSNFSQFVGGGPHQLYARLDSFSAGRMGGLLSDGNPANNRFGPLTITVAPGEPSGTLATNVPTQCQAGS